MRRFATVIPLLTVAALLAPAAAHARVVVVATGDGTATLTDVATNQVVARAPVGGRSRAAGVAPDGSRGYVAAGDRVLGIDLATRVPVGAAPLAGTATGLAVSSDGVRLFAGRAGAIDVIDAATFTVAGTIALPRSATPTSLAVSTDGSRLAAVVDRRHVAIVNLATLRLIRRVEISGPSAVAFAPGRTDLWVA